MLNVKLPMKYINKERIRIAVSGTYSTGKTTTSYALSFLTGIPRTHAQTMREILPAILPGKRLEKCTPPDLCELGMRRLTERVISESSLKDGFISDGSALHEWVYGLGRMKVGLNPNAGFIKRFWTNIKYMRYVPLMNEFLSEYGMLVREHTAHSYDIFIHLPIEFGISKDGHRPVNEDFRKLSDDFLLTTIKELNIPHIIVGGTIKERLEAIVCSLNLPVVMEIEEAIKLAKQETLKRNSIEIEYDRKDNKNKN